MKIEVTAKITAGVHPKHGPIVKGQTYVIDAHDFGDQLFERPDGFVPPWERATKTGDDLAAPPIGKRPASRSKGRR